MAVLGKGWDFTHQLLLTRFPTCDFRVSSHQSQPFPDKQESETKQAVVQGWQRSGELHTAVNHQISLAPSSCLLFIFAWISAGPALRAVQAVQPSQTQQGSSDHCTQGCARVGCVCTHRLGWVLLLHLEVHISAWCSLNGLVCGGTDELSCTSVAGVH